MNAQNTRQRIYDAASTLFFHKGYNDTTVSEIIAASNTNKGSFYHHFEDKKHLAYNVCISITNDIESQIKELYREIGTIERLFLQECIFWRLFFTQENIRRFTSEVNMVSYIGIKTDIFDAILDLTPANLSNRDLIMIGGLEVAMKSRLTSYVGNVTQRLKEGEFVRFYLQTWLGTYGIPETVINSYTDKAYALLEEFEIKNIKFDIEITKI